MSEGLDKKEDSIILIEFSIKKNGLGFEYKTMEEQKKGSIVMLGEVARKSPFPPTGRLLQEVDRLRYFFARTCGMWYDGFDKFLDGNTYNLVAVPMNGTDEEKDEYYKANNTIQNIRIDFVSFNGSYQIGGTVETMDEKFVKLKTPKISEEDEIFDDLDKVMFSVRTIAQEFIMDSKYDIKLEAHDIVMRALQNNEEELEKLKSMTERDMFLLAISKLEEKGALVMFSPELEAEITAAKHEKNLEDNANNQVVDLIQEEANSDSVKQFAETQTEHQSPLRGKKKGEDVKKMDDWTDTLIAKDTEPVHEGEMKTANKEDEW